MTSFPNILCLLGFIFLCSLSLSAQTNIEGQWKDESRGGIIKIYQENGLYYGKLLSSSNTEENEKIQQAQKDILILTGFKKVSDNKFCCGTIFQPKEKRSVSGSLKLEDDNTLIITGKYGIFKSTRAWTKQ